MKTQDLGITLLAMGRDAATNHKVMAAIRGKDTGLEQAIRRRLWPLGFRYFKNSARVKGHPDLLFLGAKVAVFLDSEFWHGYHYEEAIAKVKTNRDFWAKKITRNMERDKEVNEALEKQGYKVLRYWGKQILSDPDGVAAEIASIVAARYHALSKAVGITNKTTLAYIEKDDSYLLLYRNKEEGDENEGKWVGIGGHLEGRETHVQAMKREILEETGLTVTKYQYFGSVDFFNMDHPGQRMYLFKVTGFEGELGECDEGELKWIKKSDIYSLPMWEGDKLFLPLLEEDSDRRFRLLVFYDENGNLVDSIGPYRD